MVLQTFSQVNNIAYVVYCRVYKGNETNTVNNESLANLAKLHILPNFVHSKPNLVYISGKFAKTLCRQIDCYAVSPTFSHAKLSLFTVYSCLVIKY